MPLAVVYSKSLRGQQLDGSRQWRLRRAAPSICLKQRTLRETQCPRLRLGVHPVYARPDIHHQRDREVRRVFHFLFDHRRNGVNFVGGHL